MQVRNSLQYKRQQRSKIVKQQNFLLIPKNKKRQNTTNLKTQKSRSLSKSKSHSDKQNQKYKKISSKSKSKQKVSPIKCKRIQGLNTSPILSSERNCKFKRSPVRYDDKSAKANRTHREHQILLQTISTKLNSERTPVKKVSQKSKSNKQQLGSKKNKKSTKQQKNKSNQPQNKQKTKDKKIFLQVQQKNYLQNSQKSKKEFIYNFKSQQFVKRQEAFKKAKRVIPQINTKVPHRKQSYFDKQIIQKLNLQNSQYFRKKRNVKFQENTSLRQKKNQVSTQQNIHTTISYRQFGTSTEQTYLNTNLNQNQNMIFNPNLSTPTPAINQSSIQFQGQNQPLSKRDLQSFRKQQQLKWKIIYLQLNELKLARTPQKIEYIIEESNRNINQFQQKCKQLVESQIKNTYIIESPRKIMNVLRKNRKSSELIQIQNRSLIKTLSDQKLLQQLQILDNFEQISHIKNSKEEYQKPSSSSFCLQFQKQLQNLAQTQQHNSNANLPFRNVQLGHIPQLQYQKSNKILEYIEQQLLIEFSQQVAQNQNIFHSYLLYAKRPETDSQLQKYPKILSSQSYSIDLMHKLFKFIKQQQYNNVILTRINVAYGRHPIVVLKILRNYLAENQDQLYEDQGDLVQQCIDGDLLNYFQSEAYTQSIVENQYFYNHCLYGCVNEILDGLRPFGMVGLPPLLAQARPIHTNITQLFNQTFTKLRKILQIKMGRSQFGQGQNPLKIAEHSYTLLDRFLVQQMQQTWKKMQDDIFEQKYFLAESIINDIFNEEILMIYNEFI